MLEFLSKELSDQLRAAQQTRQRRKSRLRVHVDQVEYPVLRLWVDGMALQAEGLSHLRGLVDIYDGSRHVLQCLIIASELDGNDLICTFKCIHITLIGKDQTNRLSTINNASPT